ncbi:MAG: biopolymer transporter ExbD, partial [Desulfobulbaceae bacterium]|nr:biopolymer transporter ExbD [Desulfobulbaceae bacterium]
MSMTQAKSGKKRLVSEINVTPLVDVMLVLLIIFMVTAPMMTQGIDLDLQHEVTNIPKEQKDKPLVIAISQDGQNSQQITLNGDKMSRDQLMQKL